MGEVDAEWVLQRYSLFLAEGEFGGGRVGGQGAAGDEGIATVVQAASGAGYGVVLHERRREDVEVCCRGSGGQDLGVLS